MSNITQSELEAFQKAVRNVVSEFIKMKSLVLQRGTVFENDHFHLSNRAGKGTKEKLVALSEFMDAFSKNERPLLRFFTIGNKLKSEFISEEQKETLNEAYNCVCNVFSEIKAAHNNYTLFVKNTFSGVELHKRLNALNAVNNRLNNVIHYLNT